MKRKHQTRGVSIYDLGVYKDFREICRRENSNFSREVNRFMTKVIKVGTVEVHVEAANADR